MMLEFSFVWVNYPFKSHLNVSFKFKFSHLNFIVVSLHIKYQTNETKDDSTLLWGH